MIDCPEYIIALLFYIEEELDRIMWNIHQEEYDSPFRNSGNVKGFRTDVLKSTHMIGVTSHNHSILNTATSKLVGISISAAARFVIDK